MRFLLPALLASCFLFTGCYQAQMVTGQEASDTVVQDNWAPAYLYGLVAAEMDVSAECTNGIAVAEREMSFLNMLVSALTIGIYSPQTISVTCADGMQSASALSGPRLFSLPPDASPAQLQEVLRHAAAEAVRTQRPVHVQWNAH